jgi:filamentous hemagglutinin
LQVAAFCNAKPDQCTATAIKAAALVLAPVIGVAYGAVAIELLVSAGRLTIAEAALLVNLGGPAGYCNLKPDTCLLIADVAAGLASGSVAPSVLPPGSIKAVATMGEALGGKAASSTVSGYISGAKVCESACAISGLTKQEQLMANLIRDSSDNQGVLTEKLLESVATRTGMTVLSGGKYGSNNGFDLVLQGKDGTVTIIMDGKQLAESGAVKLSTAGAGGTNQMSSDWVREVIERIRAKNPNSPAIAAIEVARDGGTLMTAIGGVNRSTGQLLVFPVLVSNKSPSNVSLIPK